MSGVTPPEPVRSPLRAVLEQAPHLSALVAVLVLAVLAASFTTLHVRRLVHRSIHHLAVPLPDAKVLGMTVIREAMRHPDLLPAFGSSELVRGQGRPFYGPIFFRDAPSGFVLFPVASLGATPLTTLLEIGAAGRGVRGKPVVISFTPQVYLSKGHDRFDKAYHGNFSPLQANSLAFSTDLSRGLEHDIAIALLSHSSTLRNELLLGVALRARASGTSWGKVRFALLYPLGRLEGVLYRLADDALVWRFLRNQSPMTAHSPGLPARPDWTALTDSAERVTRATSSGNPWGIGDQFFAKYGRHFTALKDTKSPEQWLANMNQGYGWPELDLLLRLLRERGARPLMVTMPKHGPFDDYAGLPAGTRQAYYDRFRSAVAPFGFPVETFERYDTSKSFLNDPDSHMSPKGWLIYDQLVDAYYHDAVH